MSAVEQKMVLDSASMLDVELTDPPGSGAEHFDNASDESCWEGLLCEDVEPTQINALLRECGWDAVLCHDSTGGVRGDIRLRTAKTFGLQAGNESFNEMVKAASFDATLMLAYADKLERHADYTAVMGFLEPKHALIDVKGALSAKVLLQAWHAGTPLPEMASLDSLRQTCVRPLANASDLGAAWTPR